MTLFIIELLFASKIYTLTIFFLVIEWSKKAQATLLKSLIFILLKKKNLLLLMMKIESL